MRWMRGWNLPSSGRSPQGERGLKLRPHALIYDDQSRSPQGERGLKCEMSADKIDLFSNVDQDAVEEYNFDRIQADMNGDTYCSNCDKFIEGKVRICPYCGQYVD